MSILHTKKFGIYHWDTFDNVTILIGQAETIKDAENKVRKRYGKRIDSSGADVVDIVDKKGNIKKSFSVT